MSRDTRTLVCLSNDKQVKGVLSLVKMGIFKIHTDFNPNILKSKLHDPVKSQDTVPFFVEAELNEI